MPKEPDLSSIVESTHDRLAIRNIVYTAWSLFNSESASSTGSYHVRSPTGYTQTERVIFITLAVPDSTI